MLRIWGRLSSVNVQKVVWCCDEIGLPYERLDAGGAFGRNNTPEYLAMNPNGLIPVIEDDGFILYESNAIVRYLAAKHGSPLFPPEAHARADVDRWMEWQSTGYTPAMVQAFWQLVRTPPEKRDMASVEASRVKARSTRLSSTRIFAIANSSPGNAFSTADVVVGCAAHRWLNLPMAREPRPHLERWYAMLKSRPGAAPGDFASPDLIFGARGARARRRLRPRRAAGGRRARAATTRRWRPRRRARSRGSCDGSMHPRTARTEASRK
jgi:glutathione S-transferase